MAVESYLDFKTMELSGKRVFLRLDLNVPLKDGQILDANRIEAALPTLNFLLESKAKVIVASHLGRPKSSADREKLSLEPVAQFFIEKGFEVLLMENPDSEAPLELTKGLGDKQIIMLENLRFSPGETENSSELAVKWARYTDVYINDAFGACHRAHASTDALPKLIPQRAFGFLIEKERAALDKIKNQPERPFAILTGGGKVSDKIPLLEAFADKVDTVMIGGAMAYTFMKADGISVGKSKIENQCLSIAKSFLNRMNDGGKKVLLPVDHVVVNNFGDTDFTVIDSAEIPEDKLAVDIGPKTRTLFADAIKEAGSIFWNGPMGVYEQKPFDEGSIAMAKALSETSAFTVVGGGDSAAAAIDSGYADKMDHISTGGGASLEYIQGKKLPGLESLKVRKPE